MNSNKLSESLNSSEFSISKSVSDLTDLTPSVRFLRGTGHYRRAAASYGRKMLRAYNSVYLILRLYVDKDTLLSVDSDESLALVITQYSSHIYLSNPFSHHQLLCSHAHYLYYSQLCSFYSSRC